MLDIRYFSFPGIMAMAAFLFFGYCFLAFLYRKVPGKSFRILAIAAFFIYICFIVWNAVISRIGTEFDKVAFWPMELVVKCLNGFMGTPMAGILFFVKDFLVNILMFSPFGFLLAFVSEKNELKKTILYAFLLSLAIELTQLIFRAGVFSTGDLLSNTIGAYLGYLLNRALTEKKINGENGGK